MSKTAHLYIYDRQKVSSDWPPFQDPDQPPTAHLIPKSEGARTTRFDWCRPSNCHAVACTIGLQSPDINVGRHFVWTCTPRTQFLPHTEALLDSAVGGRSVGICPEQADDDLTVVEHPDRRRPARIRLDCPSKCPFVRGRVKITGIPHRSLSPGWGQTERCVHSRLWV